MICSEIRRQKSVKNDHEMEVATDHSFWRSGSEYSFTLVTICDGCAKLVTQLKNDPHTPGGHTDIGSPATNTPTPSDYYIQNS